MARQIIPPVLLHYPSVSALHNEAVSTSYALTGNQTKVNRYLASSNDEWLGIKGGAPAALRALSHGFPEGEKAVNAFHDAIAESLPRALGHSRAKKRGAFGDEVDVHSMMRGNFDRAWTSSTRMIRKGSGILRLVVDIGANGHTSADELRWRGIAGLALSEVMRKAGYSVEIVAAFAVQNIVSPVNQSNAKMMCSVVVKPRSTSPDIGLLSATVALPAFFRTLGFAAIIRAADNQGRFIEDGLGNYLDVSGVLPVPDKVTQLFVPQSVISEQTAIDWVRQSVALLQGARA